MDITYVQSTNVLAVGYEPESMTMQVHFIHGGVYNYFGVAFDLYRMMLLPYPWRRVGHIVKAHPCQRVA